MSETAYGYAVRVLKSDRDIKVIERCAACYGLGYVLVSGAYETVDRGDRFGSLLVPVWREEYNERCERCNSTGVERIERYSEEPDEPEICYGETRQISTVTGRGRR